MTCTICGRNLTVPPEIGTITTVIALRIQLDPTPEHQHLYPEWAFPIEVNLCWACVFRALGYRPPVRMSTMPDPGT